jgi:hypothetical protein
MPFKNRRLAKRTGAHPCEWCGWQSARRDAAHIIDEGHVDGRPRHGRAQDHAARRTRRVRERRKATCARPRTCVEVSAPCSRRFRPRYSSARSPLAEFRLRFRHFGVVRFTDRREIRCDL